MSKTPLKTLPLLRGALKELTPWPGSFGVEGFRVYPYGTGCLVRADTTTVAVLTHGLGDIADNDRVMVCTPVNYGDAIIYEPDPTRVASVASFGANAVSTRAAADDDRINLVTALTIEQDEYLLTLGTDSIPPAYASSPISLYEDNVGNNVLSVPYLITGKGGYFSGWIESGWTLVDLLITNQSGTPLAVIPFYPLGTEVIAS